MSPHRTTVFSEFELMVLFHLIDETETGKINRYDFHELGNAIGCKGRTQLPCTIDD